MAVSLFGCKEKENEITSGGKVENNDDSAVKIINSKKIVEFSASFYVDLDEPLDDNYTGKYAFKIENNVLSENLTFKISETIDETTLQALQAIIDKYELVKHNGIHSYTAGLPGEYEAFNFEALYDSGEKLSFSEDNDPDSEWFKEIFKLFRETFIKLGHDELKASKEAIFIENFYLEFNIGDTAYSFSPYTIGEDTKLLRIKNSFANNEEISEIADLDESFYNDFTKLLIELNTKRFNKYKMANSGECIHNSAGYYEIYIDFENGKQIYDYSNNKDEVADFNKDSEKLLAFFEEYMNSHNITLYE